MEGKLERIAGGGTSRGWALIASASMLVGVSLLGADRTSMLIAASTAASLYVLALLMRSILEVKSRYMVHLRVWREGVGRFYEGERVRVRVNVENPTHIPLAPLEVRDNPPATLRPLMPSSTCIVLPPRGTASFEYEVEGFIGRHVFGRVEITLKDPLGLFYESYIAYAPFQVKVRPRIEGVEGRILERIYTPSFGAAKSRIKGVGLEYAGVREYSPGDDYKRIEWKATARTGELKTKEYELESRMRILFVLDFSRSMMYGRRGLTKLEYSARAIASLARHLLRKGDYVGVVVFSGGAETSEAPISSGELHLKRILEAIASSRPVSADKRMLPKVVVESVARLSRWRRILVILVTDLEPNERSYHESLAEGIEKVRGFGDRVGRASPSTPLFEVEAASGMGRVLYSVYAYKSWSRRWEAIRMFRERGIPVLNVGPRDMVGAIARKIEELRPLAPL